jgi:hypothetical protein
MGFLPELAFCVYYITQMDQFERNGLICGWGICYLFPNLSRRTVGSGEWLMWKQNQGLKGQS